MQTAFFRPDPGWWRPDLRRRVVAIVVTLIIEALFLMAFLFAIRTTDRQTTESSLATFNVSAGPKAERPAKPKPRAAGNEKAVTPPAPRKTPLPTPLIRPNQMVIVSKEDFAASDIGKLPTKGAAAGGSASAYGPGEGPGGAPLYNAEWYREPSDGELAFYLPPSRPPGSWAEIMCRTIENYHVDNCRTLGESPAGSGLAKGLRLAAWQLSTW